MKTTMMGRFFSAALVLTAAIAAPPAHAQMFGALPIDGVRCEATEGALQHVHIHLQLFNRGRSVTVPGEIGISRQAQCLYWLHTHRDDGMIHIEAPVSNSFTLGQFFDIWGKGLSKSQAGPLQAPRGRTLRFTVNGKVWTKDPRSIPLRNHEEIAVQNGPPYAAVRPADWSRM